MSQLLLEFNALHQQYDTMVLQLCIGYMKGDRDLAMDLAQEVFINIWKALPGFKKTSSPKTWIYRIAVNTCLLYIRDNKVKQTQSIEGLHDSVPTSISPDKESEHQELYIAIGQLVEIDRLIIMMVLEEMEYEEIARILGINSMNLRVKIHRIKTKLRDLLNKNKNGRSY